VTTTRPRPQHADSGASLILAIGFVLVIGLIGGALAMLVTSGLGNRTTLQKLRNTQYSADGAIEQAISQVRGLTCTTPSGSIADTAATKLNSIAIRVDWVTDCTGMIQGADGTFLTQRDVIFTACSDTGTPCDPARAIIRAQVNFQQQVAGGAVTKTYVLSWSVNQ
jgi:type II secretory pathway pseudopilin PulG